MLGHNREHNLPVDLLIGMNGYISEADSLGHSLRNLMIETASTLQGNKGSRHGFRYRNFKIADNVQANINTLLNGTFKVAGNDILQIVIIYQFFVFRQRLALNPRGTGTCGASP